MDSQAIINTMEVLEVKPLNELVTEAIVKVCYVSETQNNNWTVINREVGKEIAATLPGAPVVGLYDEDTHDFVEHSRKLTIKDGEIKWKDLTRPYGFVSPIHQPWYQDFIENGVKRTYLMCKVFLWTRQYEEANQIHDKGQSMELNEKDMSGYYEGDVFIFTHATLDKLCVLGDKYEPCFEGAGFLTAYSKGYNSLAEQVEAIIGKRYYVLDDKLVEKTPGSTQSDPMPTPNDPIVTEPIAVPVDPITEPVTEPVVEPVTEPVVESVPATEPIPEPSVEPAADPATEPAVEPATEPVVEPAATEPAVEPAAEPVEPATEPVVEPATESTEPVADPAVEPAVEPAAEPSAEFTALTDKVAYLEQQIAEKDSHIAELEASLNTYRQKEAAAMEEAKNAMVSSYKSLLTDEEIKPVLDKLSELSLDDVESKLSVTYARKQRAAASATNNIQVNVATVVTDDEDVPEFMKQAMAYDRDHGLNLHI